jgi:hypothetical protein
MNAASNNPRRNRNIGTAKQGHGQIETDPPVKVTFSRFAG